MTRIITAIIALLFAASAPAVVIEPDHIAEGSDADVRPSDGAWTDFNFLNADDDTLRIGHGGHPDGVVELIHNRLRFAVPDAPEPGWEFRAHAAGANLIGVAEDFDLTAQSVDVWAETNLDREGMDDGLLNSIADYAVDLRNSGQLFKTEIDPETGEIVETDPWPAIDFVGSSTVSVEGQLIVDLTTAFNAAIAAEADWFEITMTPGWRAFPPGEPENRTGQAAFFFEEPSPFDLASAIAISDSGPTQVVLGDPEDISLPEIVSIPEPATLALVGLGGLVMARRRR